MVQTDMAVKDTAETFFLYRTYQSVYENKGGLLGSRWYLNVGSWLYVEGDRAAAILPDMHIERFTKKDNEWENDHNGDRSVWLKENRDGYCLTVMEERKQYHYNHEGQLMHITDRNGSSIWLRYAGKTLLEMAFFFLELRGFIDNECISFKPLDETVDVLDNLEFFLGGEEDGESETTNFFVLGLYAHKYWFGISKFGKGQVVAFTCQSIFLILEMEY